MIVTSLDPVRISDGNLWIEAGRIAAPGEGSQIDCDGVIVVPGNVCAHTHLYSALARDYFGMRRNVDPADGSEVHTR